jgi:membrane protein DedA with SNARE-associated domain
VAYLTTFVAVLSTAVTPVPEETVLLGAGWLAHLQRASLVVVIVCAWVAILAGDTATFALGRGLVRGVARSRWLLRVMPPERRAWADREVARHGGRAILLARFLIGLRGFLYFALGGSPYPFRRFLAVDAAVGAVEVALVVVAGWFVGATRRARAGLQLVDLIAVAVIVVTLALPWLLRRFIGGAPSQSRPRT